MNARFIRTGSALLALACSVPAVAADKAVARLIGQDGKPAGQITLTESPHGVLLHVTLKDVPPGPKAIHIHSVGNCEDHDHGFKASKSHLNPDGREHGLMNPKGPDAGDLPNIYVHADGSAEAQFFTTRATLGTAAGRAPVLDADGAAILIHEKGDDHMTQPIGGAGARIACGVVKAE